MCTLYLYFPLHGMTTPPASLSCCRHSVPQTVQTITAGVALATTKSTAYPFGKASLYPMDLRACCCLSSLPSCAPREGRKKHACWTSSASPFLCHLHHCLIQRFQEIKKDYTFRNRKGLDTEPVVLRFGFTW